MVEMRLYVEGGGDSKLLRANALPAAGNPLESVAKAAVYRGLADATNNCKIKIPYGKGEHSFLILAKIDPAKVTAASRWAERFVSSIRKEMGY